MQRNKTNASFTAKVMLAACLAAVLMPQALFADNATAPEYVYAVQQQAQVKGNVVDEFGEPMIGVTVRVKGTQAATITDLDGNFTINAKPGQQIELSYVGYLTQTVKAENGLKINMKPDSQMMEEVVVVGYGTVKRRDVLGAISQVKSDDIKQAPTMSAMEGLQGKIAGLDITRESGAAGTSPTILLRGNRSIDGNNSPLFVIDGISGGDIDNINPNDIESIEVLKDASSTAIYGSAGANGVIIVTTKKGSKGKVQVDFNAYLGLNCMPAYPETYQGSEWVDYLNTGYEAYYGKTVAEMNPTITDADGLLDRLFNEYGLSSAAIQCYKDGKFINWKDEILQTGVQQNYNISVRGGTDKLTSYMSAGFQNEKGMYRNDNYKQITFRTGSTYEVNKMISMGVQMDLSYRDRDRRNSRLSKTLNEVPLGEVYNEDGTLKKHPTGLSTDYVNIMADDIEYAYLNNTKSTRINISPYIEIKPLKGLSFKSLFNAGISTSRNGQWEGLDTYYKLTGSSQDIGVRTASKTHSDSWSIQWQNIVNYAFKIKDIHDISVMGLVEYNQGTSESSYLSNRGFDFDSYTWNALDAGQQAGVSSTYTQTRRLSYAGRINYNILGRYLFSATMRWDGSSVLYNKWDSFPSVSAGWRISDEAFMESTRDWLDNLKLRIGYGVTGNSNVPAYSSKTLIEAKGESLNLGGGSLTEYILKENVANYALSWEKSYNWNVGIDFGFFNGRIDGSLEWYTTDTKGVLYKRQLPTVFGLYNAKTPYKLMSNVARIKNTGVELTLNTRNIIKKNFTWSSTVSFSTNSEKLKNIDLGNGTSVDELVSLGLFIDNPVKTYYGYKKIGIWQNGQEDQAACFGLQPGQVHIDAPGLIWDPGYTYEGYTSDRVTNEKTAVTRHGAYYTVDADGNKTYYRQGTIVVGDDGSTTIEGENLYSVGAKDKQILGHKQPKFTIGFNNNFTFHNFDLAIQTVMRWGQMVNGDLLGYANGKNQPTSFDYWTPTNATNAFPLAKLGVSNEAKEAMLYVDGSFVKIKNITLGYNLPKNVLKKLNMSKLRVYATINNPFIFVKDGMLKGLDPENTSSDFPLFKTIVFGVNCSF